MIWKTAWKNIWRKKTRSLIIILSVVVGVFAGVFTIGMMNGMTIQRVDSALNTEISHIHIQHEKFNDNYDIKYKITSTDSIVDLVKKIKGVNGITRRTIVTGMINTTNKSSGVKIVGINPEEEINVFNLSEFTIEETGSYFSTVLNKPNRIYIGEALAKDLNIIWYILKTDHFERLRSYDVPEEVIAKTELLIGIRFKNEKLFIKALKQILSDDELSDYTDVLTHVSQNYRRRARLVLTFLDNENNQTGGTFKIAGIYNLSNNLYERSQVFILNSDLKPLLGVGDNEYHQLIVKLNDTDSTNIVLDDIKKVITNYEVKSWKEISLELAMTTDLVKQFYTVFMLIILIALAFGILNTMLMVVLERTKELGMLTAIGMNKKKVFSMIMLESVFLSLIGGIIGMFFSVAVINLTARNGIDLSFYAESFQDMGFPSLIYPQLDNEFYFIVTIMIIITGVISAIYPAYKALKINPSDAIRSE